MKLDEIIARILFKLGKKPCWSTGVCGSLTRGYGELDHNGYWKYPLPELMKSEWLTVKSAEEAAKSGLISALSHSLKRWRQMQIMTVKELYDSGYIIDSKYNDTATYITAEFCAVCFGNEFCRSCVLTGKLSLCCGGDGLDKFIAGVEDNDPIRRSDGAEEVMEFIERVIKEQSL